LDVVLQKGKVALIHSDVPDADVDDWILWWLIHLPPFSSVYILKASPHWRSLA
jgi:hypothetical protein